MTTLSDAVSTACATLPESAGVYFFYRDQTLRYLGKSINIRQRVQSHLSAARRGGKEARYVFAANRLEFERSSSELHALLRESALIKSLQPLYNKRLRRPRQLWSWQLTESGKTALPQLVHHQWPPPENMLQWGLFRNRTRANSALRALCKDALLCEQTLGLSKGSGPCFQYQLRRCRGVCAGRETTSTHHQRLIKAFSERAHNVWPYPGPMAIHHGTQGSTVSVLHAWNYLGDYPCLDAAEKALQRSAPLQARITQLDLDGFRIALSFLRHHQTTPLHAHQH